jgi:hypothetical protein
MSQPRSVHYWIVSGLIIVLVSVLGVTNIVNSVNTGHAVDKLGTVQERGDCKSRVTAELEHKRWTQLGAGLVALEDNDTALVRKITTAIRDEPDVNATIAAQCVAPIKDNQ